VCKRYKPTTRTHKGKPGAEQCAGLLAAAVEGEDSRWQRDMGRASQGKNLSRQNLFREKRLLGPKSYIRT